MKFVFAFLLVAAACFSCNNENNNSESTEKLRDVTVAEALEDFDQGRLKEALEKAETVLSEYPDDFGAMRIKSMILASMGKYKEASVVLEKIAKQEPEDLDIQHILGTAYFKQELWEKAIKHLEIAKTAPNRRDKASELLVVSYEKMGQIDRATNLLEEMLTENAQDPVLLTHLGNLQASSGEYRKAVSNFRKALEHDGQLPAAHHGLAISLAALDEYKEVIKVLNKAVHIFPKEPGFRITLAETYLQQNQPLDAIEVIDQLELMVGKSKEVELLRNTAEMMLKSDGKPVPPR